MIKDLGYDKYKWVAVFIGDPRNAPEALFQQLYAARAYAQRLAHDSMASAKIVWYTNPERKPQIESIDCNAHTRSRKDDEAEMERLNQEHEDDASESQRNDFSRAEDETFHLGDRQ